MQNNKLNDERYVLNKKEKEQRHVIKEVYPDSIAEELEIEAGDVLLAINDQAIQDVFDYRYLIKNEYIEVLVEKQDGEEWLLEIDKDYDEDLGIEFENGLMSEYRTCSNKCIFCFIDQMPPGMRETLYFKDDDSRLSFLQGNYITLTNMKLPDNLKRAGFVGIRKHTSRHEGTAPHTLDLGNVAVGQIRWQSADDTVEPWVYHAGAHRQCETGACADVHGISTHGALRGLHIDGFEGGWDFIQALDCFLEPVGGFHGVELWLDDDLRRGFTLHLAESSAEVQHRRHLCLLHRRGSPIDVRQLAFDLIEKRQKILL